MNRPVSRGKRFSSTDARRTGQRAEMILDYAGVLFGKSGFHAVSLDDIGAGLGITGPAVYRYFNSKQSILALIYDRILNELITRAELALRDCERPDQALEALVDVHLDYALDNPHLVRLYANERSGLSAVDERRVQELQRAWQAIWMNELRALRDDLSTESAEVIIFAAQWAIASVGFHRTAVAREERRIHVRATVLQGIGQPTT